MTDRCNLRCVYCMPPEGVELTSHNDVMRYEEIAQVVAEAAKHGVRQVRITGGEPLVRPGLPDLIKLLSSIPELDDISLTTNGILLERMAPELAEAGLNRVNVSLDTLNPEKYQQITRYGDVNNVWRGLEKAEACNLTPIKINAVAMCGFNDDEFLEIASLSLEYPWHIRFIELMPVKELPPWGPGLLSPADAFISTKEIKNKLESLDLEPAEGTMNGGGPARLYKARGGVGFIGFISPLSEHFCQSCNRIRLTADGFLRPCLLSDIEIPVLEALRAGESVMPCFEKVMMQKPSGHELGQTTFPSSRSMMEIGG